MVSKRHDKRAVANGDSPDMQRDTSDMDSASQESTQGVSKVSSGDNKMRGDAQLGSLQYVSTKEAADLLCVTQQTARNWLKVGVLEGYAVQGGKRSCIRITRQSVENVKSGKAWKLSKDSNSLG